MKVTIDQIKADSPNALATGPFGSAISSKFFTDKGVPVIRGGNLSADISNRLSETGLVFISTRKAEEFKRSEVKNGDLVFTCWGTINQVGLIDGKGSYPAYIISNKQMKLTPHSNKADSFFLYYFFSSPQMQEQILSNNIGSSVPGFNLGQLKTIELMLPPLPEQKVIASVLSSLDDKIDLLHRQNKTLEAMAEMIFRQWFVEEAQEDWEEKSLLGIIQLIGGGTPITTTAEYWDGDIPWLAGGDIASNHKSFINYSEKSITEVGLNNSSAKLLPKFATVVSARGTVGKYCLLAKPMAFSQSNYGILPNISKCFFFSYLLINHVVEELKSSAYGSVFDTITTTTFKDIKIPLPTETDIFRFEKSVSQYFKKMFLNESQILTLVKLRDTLLPKLMSGEVRVEYENCEV